MIMRIEQLLHGYNNGHTLISGSIHLKSAKDAANMALFSDWSEYRDPNHEDSSYLTSYHLLESPYYVISKTWYASEMERPGSVWTHSLLIRLNELEMHFDFRSLINIFKRPQIGKYREYENSILIDIDKQSVVENVASDFISIEWLYIYTMLLNQASPMVFTAEKSSYTYQMMCLSLMQFIPTDILTQLSFCSGSTTGRKLGKIPISLQFVMAGGTSLQKHLKNGALTTSNFDNGLQYVVRNFGIQRQNVSVLIRMFSLDIGGSCDKFCAVANLLQLLDNAKSKKETIASYEDVLMYLTKYFPSDSEGVVLKNNFLNKKISNLFCSEENFFYMLCTIKNESALSFESLINQERLDLFISNSREDYINLLCRLSESETLNVKGKAVILQCFTKLTSSEIESISESHWDFYLTLLMFKSDLLNNMFWITLPRAKFIQILNQFSDRLGSILKDWEPLLNRILKGDMSITHQLAEDLIRHTPNVVSILMDYLNIDTNQNLNIELSKGCLSRTKEILHWINYQDHLSSNIITILVTHIPPSSGIVQQSGSKVWLKLLDSDNGKMGLNYYIFLFILSFNWKDETSLKCLRISFYHLHEALRYSFLSNSMWMQLIPYTKELPFWQDWDKCKKLRKGVVRYLKKSGFHKTVLNNFTPDIELNKKLMDD